MVAAAAPGIVSTLNGKVKEDKEDSASHVFLFYWESRNFPVNFSLHLIGQNPVTCP